MDVTCAGPTGHPPQFARIPLSLLTGHLADRSDRLLWVVCGQLQVQEFDIKRSLRGLYLRRQPTFTLRPLKFIGFKSE